MRKDGDNDEGPKISLHEAAARGDVEALEAAFAALQGKKPAAAEDLPSPNELDWRGQSPLCVAAINGQAEAVRVLLEKCGADVNGQNPAGHTALHRAIMWGHTDCVAVLLELEAATGVCTAADASPGNETAEMMAARYGRTELIKMLREADAARKQAAEEAAQAEAEGGDGKNDKTKKKKK